MKDVGARFLFLPPGSPELDLIEMAFAKLKAHLRPAAARPQAIHPLKSPIF